MAFRVILEAGTSEAGKAARDAVCAACSSACVPEVSALWCFFFCRGELARGMCRGICSSLTPDPLVRLRRDGEGIPPCLRNFPAHLTVGEANGHSPQYHLVLVCLQRACRSP